MTVPPDLPPDNGQKPSIDDKGQVHGSGVGAGGGQAGEDFSSDSAAGSGPPRTGADREIKPDA